LGSDPKVLRKLHGTGLPGILGDTNQEFTGSPFNNLTELPQYERIWGKSIKYLRKKIDLEHVMMNGIIIQIN